MAESKATRAGAFKLDSAGAFELGSAGAEGAEEKFLEHAFKGVQPVERPVFLLKYGPPGSGKSTCMDAFLQTASEYGDVKGLDSIVEADVDQVVSKLDTKQQLLQKPYDPQVYEKLRKEANPIVDLIVQRAIATKRNLALEMTGGQLDPIWLKRSLVEPLRQKGYVLIVVYPLVPPSTLIERATLRAETIGRRPDDLLIQQIVYAASAHLGQLLPLFDHVIVYDNRADASELGRAGAEGAEEKNCKTVIVHCRAGKCTVQLENKIIDLECPEGQCRPFLSEELQRAFYKLYGTTLTLQPPELIYYEHPTSSRQLVTAVQKHQPFVLMSEKRAMGSIHRVEFWGKKPVGGGGNEALLFLVLVGSDVSKFQKQQLVDRVHKILLELVGPAERTVFYTN